MDVTIEPATSDDSDEVTALWVDLAADQRDHGSHLLPDANRQHIRKTVLRHVVENGLVVARAEGDIAGFVMFTVESGGYEQDRRRGLVENLYVEPSARDEGVGTELLAAAERRLTERGVDTVALEVMAANEAARRFYRRQGYEPHRVEMEKPVESDTHSKGDE